MKNNGSRKNKGKKVEDRDQEKKKTAYADENRRQT